MMMEQGKLFAEFKANGFQGMVVGGSKLSQEHLHISAYPIDSRGNLCVQVRATTKTWAEVPT